MRLDSPELTIPHPDVIERPFVLDPWAQISAGRRLPLGNDNGPSANLLALRRRLSQSRSLLMGIVNITPDSFSDGGQAFNEIDLADRLNQLLLAPPSIIDLGGQSTRPGAEIVGIDEEWRRLSLALELLRSYQKDRVRPWLSIDTFRPELARRAIEWGAEIINDVSGLSDPEMREVAAGSRAHFVFMHHCGIPVTLGQTLPVDCDPVAEIYIWAERQIETLTDAGIDVGRLIFDPGIGFGKTPEQSLQIIRRASEFQRLPVRVMFGHSRKSYQRRVDSSEMADRDAITLVHSLHLARSGVEILRVHNVAAHRSALLAESRGGRS